jgi:hypothetical protein
LLGNVRGEIRRHVALDGLLLAVIWALAIFWLGAALDYLPVRVGATETPRWVRAGLLLVIAGGVAWALIWRLARRLLARLPDRSLAVLLERRFPQLNNELVTAVELVEQPEPEVSNRPAYRAMLERVHASAAAHVEGLEAGKLLNWRPIMLLCIAAGALSLLTVAVTLAAPGWMRLWSQRLVLLSDQNWPRRARLYADGIQYQLPTFTGQMAAERMLIPFSENTLRVPRGAALQLQVSADTRAEQVPDLCTLFYRSGDGSRGRANLRRVGNRQTNRQLFTLDGPPLLGLTDNLDFHVIGGDARLDHLRLQVIDPALASDLQLDVQYPSYLASTLGNRPQRERLAYRNGMRVPEGAQVTLVGSASADLRDVQYVVRSTQARRGNTSGDEAAGGAASGDSEIVVQAARPEGRQFTIPLGELTTSVVVEIRVIDEYGLAADQIPRYLIQVAEDLAPELDTRLVGIGTAVTPRARIPIRGSVTDDHGLARVWTTLVVNEDPPLEIEAAVDAEGKLETEIDLLQLAESRGVAFPTDATLGMVTSGTDYYDLGGRQHTGNGQPFQLAIVNEDKLLVTLDRQELELRQRLEQIISELKQLSQALREQSQAPSAQGMPPAGATTRSNAAPASYLPASHWTRVPTARAAALVSFRAAAVQEPDENEPADDDGPAENVEQQRRLALLRAQQSILQADKSQQELLGVANRVEDIRQQLINNRIDSVDRQTRLQERVYVPLQAALQGEMEELRSRLGQLQTAAMSPPRGREPAAAAADACDRLLVALDGVLSNMLDLESFNEIIDLVRGLLDDEDRILEETQKKQKDTLRRLLESD